MLDKGTPNLDNVPELAPELWLKDDLNKIEAAHRKAVADMFQQIIPAEPNIGAFPGYIEKDYRFKNLEELREAGSTKWPDTEQHLKTYLEQPGKGLRPLLLVSGARSFSRQAERTPEIMRAAAGIELLHELALAFDDVMDGSEMRRNGLSLWARLRSMRAGMMSEKEAKKLATDLMPLCFSWSRHLMVDTASEEIRPQVSEAFWEAVQDMKKGQISDLEYAKSSEWPTLSQALEALYLKTGTYSIKLPLIYAYIASRQQPNENVLQGINRFSRGYGLAFQLHDDLLLLQSDAEIGKDSKIDIRNGNKIPLAIVARTRASASDKEFFDTVWGKPEGLEDEEIKRLKDLFRSTGALAENLELINQSVSEAVLGLDMIEREGYDMAAMRLILKQGLSWMDDLDRVWMNER